ncbi:MAG: phage baseplate assembly protein V [Thermotogota bacterium]
MSENTGFKGDEHRGKRLDGLYMGRVVDRTDPDGNGRIRVEIPGVIDGKSAWATPRGGGSPLWGFIAVPPLEADVYVQFINGDESRPVYEPADWGVRGSVREIFPEFEDPDVIVGGFGPFRIVIDLRDSETVKPSLRVKQVAKTKDGEETDTAWFVLSENSAGVHGDAAAQVSSGALTDIASDGDVQVKGRKVMPAGRPIS